MSDERPSEVLGALPRARPHRRSQKRTAPAGTAPAAESDPGSETVSANEPEPGSDTVPANEPEPGSDTTDVHEPCPDAASADLPEPPWDVTGGDADGTPEAAHPRLHQPAQPKGLPTTPRRRPESQSGTPVLDTAVRAAAELTEIGLRLSARAIRHAVARLPRP